MAVKFQWPSIHNFFDKATRHRLAIQKTSRVNNLIVSLVLSTTTLQTLAAERSILLLAPTSTDARLEASHAAIEFWNETLAQLEVDTRLGEPRVAVEWPALRTLENFARLIAQQAIRFPNSEVYPAAPEELTTLPEDIIVLLSNQDIMSFAWSIPKTNSDRYLVVIRLPRGPDRNDLMVSRHVLAHELGHALGLLHNNFAHTLMCGPCQPFTASPGPRDFLPLTDNELNFLREAFKNR